MSDPTRFDLDERQRAMLAEMGVRVWWPSAAKLPTPGAAAVLAAVSPGAGAANTAPVLRAGASPAQAAVAGTLTPSPVDSPEPHRPVAAPVARPRPESAPIAPAPAPGAVPEARPPLPEGLASMDWPALQDAVSACGACALCAQRKTPVLGAGRAPASWMVVGDPPSEQDEQSGQPFAGPEGVLLDNMLKAVGARRASAQPSDDPSDAVTAHLSCVVKCRPPEGRNPEAQELAMCAAYLSRQVALVQPRVILAMGRFAIQSLLNSTEPLGKLRGRLHDYQGVPVVVTYPPSNLLRNPADKAKAWADLVLALQVVQG